MDTSTGQPLEKPSWIMYGLAGCCAALTAICVMAMLTDISGFINVKNHVLAKVASSGFVALGVVAGGYRHAYGRAVLVGLVFCWLGDALGPVNFILGVGMFFLAHVCFIIGFSFRPLMPKRIAWALLPVVIINACILVWLLPHVPTMHLALVLAYITVISLMVITAAGISLDRCGQIALAAGIIFFISDIFVARWKYVTPGFSNALGCYPLYYSACLLFAWSIWYEQADLTLSKAES